MLARLALFIDNFVPGRFPLSEPGSLLTRYLPILQWGRQYTLEIFGRDLTAAVIGTLLLIPQSLAYALLAGLPAEAGLYASVVPIMLYAVFGTSRTMAVGPVALLSLMTASTIGQVAQAGTAGYATAALTLALLSGVMLMLMGFFRLGFLANFLSHPVISGFITASGIIIAFSQLKHILGVSAGGNNLLELGSSLIEHLPQTHWLTLLMGVLVTLFLFGVRSGLKTALLRIGIGQRVADGLVKAGPVVAVALTTWSAWQFGLADKGLAVVGVVPQSLPPWTMPDLSPRLLHELFVPALLISMIGFVESISMAQTLAARKRHRIDPDQELIGLGAANLGAAFTGGYPVTGGGRVHRGRSGHCRVDHYALALLPAQGNAGRHHYRVGVESGRSVDPAPYLAVCKAGFCGGGGDHVADLAGWGRVGCDGRCCRLDTAVSVQNIAAAHCRGWPGGGHGTLSQCRAACRQGRAQYSESAGR